MRCHGKAVNEFFTIVFILKKSYELLITLSVFRKHREVRLLLILTLVSAKMSYLWYCEG